MWRFRMMFWRLGAMLRGWRLPDVFSVSALIVAWAAIVLTIAKAFPFLRDYVPAEWNYTDAIVGFLAILLIGILSLRKDIKADTTRIIDRLEGPEYRRFTSGEEQMLHIARQIHKAQDSICDVTWVDYMSPERLSSARESAQRALDDAVITFSAHKPYREIFIFDDVPQRVRELRLAMLRKRIEEKESGYYCAFMPKSRIPRLQFMIIDNEVILRGFDKDVGDIRCSISDESFARLFRAYYARLWRAATILKDETGRNEAHLSKILASG